MEKINASICRDVLLRDKGNNYTLIADPTTIETGKREAQMTYFGYKGYRPVEATIKELGVSIAYDFKESNNMGASGHHRESFRRNAIGKDNRESFIGYTKILTKLIKKFIITYIIGMFSIISMSIIPYNFLTCSIR